MMRKYLRSLGLKGKILILVLVSSSMVLSGTIIYFSFNVRNNAVEEAKSLADSETQKYAKEIGSVFYKALECTNSLAFVFKENIELKKQVRDSINKRILYNKLINEPDYLSFWLVYELSALDPNYKRIHGRQRNVAFNLNGFTLEQSITDTDITVAPENLYYQVKASNKETMSEPYFDTHTEGLKDILMVSPVSPIRIDGKFGGVIGIDLSLDKIRDLVQKIKPFESSSAYLVASNNQLVSHTLKENFNKNIFELNKKNKGEFEKALAQTNKNQPANLVIKDNKNGNATYVSFAPIVLGEDGKVWTLVTETPLETLTAASDKLFFNTIIVGIIGLFILAIVLYAILGIITKELLSVVDFSKKITSGDLKSQIVVKNNDELGKLAESMNTMSTKLRKIVGAIAASSEHINKSSSEITSFSSQLSDGANDQASSAEEIMASVEEMTANIQNSAHNAKITEKIAEEALIGIQSGSKAANQTMKSINEIAEKITIISDISWQTNILSLNASIEAARAGQFGKGFTVVANGVKKLAERAQVAAAEIDIISEKGVKISISAEAELSKLLPDVEKTAMLIREITDSGVEQSRGAEQIQNSIGLLNNIAQKNAMLSEKLNTRAQQMIQESEELKANINYFKL